MVTFQWEEEAKREQILLRAALVGPNGSGKSLGALRIAAGFAGPEGKIAAIDTEKGRLKLYANQFRFAHLNIPPTEATPETMLAAARDAADRVGLTGVVVIDTISHEWLTVLTEADRFGNWKDLTPRHRDFLEGITSIPAHLVVTMRAKVKYEVTEEEVPGRNKPRQVINRLGVGPVQREGTEYDFDILAYLDTDHLAHFANRCEELVGTVREINDETIAIMKRWVEEGDPPDPQRIVTLKDVPVPRSWAAIKEAADAYSPETWADFREFLGQAREHLWPGVPEAELDKSQKDTLFQYAASVMTKLLETHDIGAFPPPVRIELQAHWAKVLPSGQVLDGPAWSMGPDEADSRPARTPGGQPPPEPPAAPEGSGEEQAAATPPAPAESDTVAVPSPEAAAEDAPSSLEQTVTDSPLTPEEQATLDAVKEEFPAAQEVPEQEGFKPEGSPVQTRDVPADTPEEATKA